MDKKTIQEQRMKGYFIEAAGRVVREDGVSNLTVKKVADLAGYAPGTLYNYFTDLNDLLFHCAVDFLDECRDYVLKQAENNKGIKARLISLTHAYCEYFIENPNIFKLVFLEDINNIPDNLRSQAYIPEVTLVLHQTLVESAREGIIPEEKVDIIENLIGSSTHGHLLFFIKGRSVMSREEIFELIEGEIDYLLEG